MTTTALTPLQRTVSPEYLAIERGSANYRVKLASDEITVLLNAFDFRATRGGCEWANVRRMRRAFALAMRELDAILHNGYLDAVFRDAVRRYRDAAGAYYRATDDRRPTPEHVPSYERCADTRCSCRVCSMCYYTQTLSALNDYIYCY